MLVLVRHAMPVLDPAAPARAWRLGEEGRAAARALARALPRRALIVTSTERKARQTAEELVAVAGGELRADERVGETRRPDAWAEDHRALARAYVGGEAHAGWEPHAAVVARFDAAVRDARAAARGRPLVVVDHGQALTLWLAHEVALADPAGFWEALRFPDAWLVERPPRRLQADAR